MTTAASKVDPFDFLMLTITIVLIVSLIRLIKSPEKNVLAIVFATVSLFIFLTIDAIMIQGWLSA